MSKVSVIIPNHDGEKYLPDCLRGLKNQTYTDYELIVVDNGSMDRSIDIVNRFMPQAKVVVLPENIGVPAALNKGIAESQCEYIALLQNHIVPSETWLEELVAAMDQNPRVCSLSSVILMGDKPGIIDNAGNAYTIYGLGYSMYRGKRASKLKKKPRRVFSADPQACLFRKSMLSVSGGFDDTYFAYVYDVDLGWRAMLSGYKNMQCTSAVAINRKEASDIELERYKAHMHARNNEYTIYKNMPWWQGFFFTPFLNRGRTVAKNEYAKKGFKDLYIQGIKEGKKGRQLDIRHRRYVKKPFSRQFYVGLLMMKFTFIRPFISKKQV